MGADMTESWREWEGRTVDGKFVLGNYLGGSDGSAVFRTLVVEGRVGDHRLRIEEEPADLAIKLAAVDGAEAESQLRRWKAASELRHPNLIRILAVGRAAVEGRELVYAVEELAEENLAQIVPERALTAEEARGMLGPVLGAIEFVHGKGLVHGRIRPSNILAAGDQVKLSSDSLRKAGDVPRAVSALYDAPEVAANGISTASDIWSLGITLLEVLTQHVPAWDVARMKMTAPDVGPGVPEPFRGIAQRCLQVDPAKRCGVREIVERLERRPQVKATPVETMMAAAQQKSAKWPYWLVLAAVVGVAAFLMMRPRSGGEAGDQTSSVRSQVVQTPGEQPAPVQPSQDQLSQVQAKPTPAAEAKPAAEEKAAGDDIVERVMPQVSPSARRTIQGKIKVRVRVKVDAGGNVTEATLKEAGPSKYFARVALEAARRWKFAPAQGDGRAWTLLFAFSRARTDATAARAR